MNHIVNLPVESLTHVVNIEDPRVLVPIKELEEMFMKDSSKPITVKSMYSTPDISEKIIKYNTDIATITNCTRKTIGKTHDVRYFKITVKFYPTEKEVELILPSYSKLFSRTAKSYVPAEFIRKSDILTDYTGNIVQVLTNELIEDYKPTEYYSLTLNTMNSKNPITFYLNGIFGNVCYNDFNLEEDEDDTDNEE